MALLAVDKAGSWACGIYCILFKQLSCTFETFQNGSSGEGVPASPLPFCYNGNILWVHIIICQFNSLSVWWSLRVGGGNSWAVAVQCPLFQGTDVSLHWPVGWEVLVCGWEVPTQASRSAEVRASQQPAPPCPTVAQPQILPIAFHRLSPPLLTTLA